MPTTSRHFPTQTSFFSASALATAKLAKKLSKELPGGSLLLLSGPVGSGKTTFTRALAKSLGVAEPVRSPTFVLMKQYRTAVRSPRFLVHIDAYRLTKFHELLALGMGDVLGRSDTLVIIEWPKGKSADWPSLLTYQLTFTPGAKANERTLLLRPPRLGRRG